MGKLSVSKLIDTSKFLKTQAGSELVDLFDYLARFTDQVLGAFRNQLTFEDNFRAEVPTVALQSGVETDVKTTSTPRGVLVSRVLSQGVAVDSFGWHISQSGRLVVRCVFDPVSSDVNKVTLVILY